MKAPETNERVREENSERSLANSEREIPGGDWAGVQTESGCAFYRDENLATRRACSFVMRQRGEDTDFMSDEI